MQKENSPRATFRVINCAPFCSVTKRPATWNRPRPSCARRRAGDAPAARQHAKTSQLLLPSCAPGARRLAPLPANPRGFAHEVGIANQLRGFRPGRVASFKKRKTIDQATAAPVDQLLSNTAQAMLFAQHAK